MPGGSERQNITPLCYTHCPPEPSAFPTCATGSVKYPRLLDPVPHPWRAMRPRTAKDCWRPLPATGGAPRRCAPCA
jgi:hypothetical protein